MIIDKESLEYFQNLVSDAYQAKLSFENSGDQKHTTYYAGIIEGYKRIFESLPGLNDNVNIPLYNEIEWQD